MGLIRQNQAEKFKKNYISEMKLVIDFLDSKTKSDEMLTDEEAAEAKSILCENIDKFKELG